MTIICGSHAVPSFAASRSGPAWNLATPTTVDSGIYALQRRTAPTGVGGTSISGAATEDPVGAAAGRGSWTSCLASPPAVQAETAPDPSDPLAAVHVRPEGVCSTGVGRLRPLHITSEYLRSASVRIPKAAGTRQPLCRRTLCHFRRCSRISQRITLCHAKFSREFMVCVQTSWLK